MRSLEFLGWSLFILLAYYAYRVKSVVYSPACEVTVSMIHGTEETRATVGAAVGEPCDPAALAEKARTAARENK